jgi:hypothetical protein
MNVFIIIMRIISITLMASTLICGLYIHANKAKLEDYAGSVKFHRTIGILTVLFGTVAIMI